MILRYRMTARLLVGICCAGMGSLMLCGVLFGAPPLSRPFAGAVGRTAIAILGIALALFGLNTLVNRKVIRVDRQRQRLEMEGRLFGLWVRRHAIPFAEIAGVRVAHCVDEYAHPYWRLEVILRHGMARALDSSSDAAYIERAARAMEEIIGVPVARTTFSVEAATQRHRTTK